MTSLQFLGLIHLVIFISCSAINWFLHFNDSYEEESSFGSFQVRLFLHRFFMIWQPFNKQLQDLSNGAPRPRGSYTLLNAASKPRLVTGLSLNFIWKPRVSFPILHLTPRALSLAKTPIARSLSLTPFYPCLFIVFIHVLNCLQNI